MAKLPVEIARIGNEFDKEIESVIELLNSFQKEIFFSLLSISEEEKFQILNFKEVDCDEQLDKILKIRNDLKGFHPYLIVTSSSYLKNNKYDNLFGGCDPDEGVALFTFKNVTDTIIAKDKIKSYIIYYLARYTFNFLLPDHRNHDETRDCVFDFKTIKADIIKSMKAGAICDDCRSKVINPSYSISASQFTSLNNIFGLSGELLQKEEKPIVEKANKPKFFIGSSSEGISVAQKIQNNLSIEFEVVIWNQGLFNQLGLSFLETLEQIVSQFDYGIFVFTPDDTLESRGSTKKTARDNVIFELGLFVGKLSRKKAFLVHPRNIDMHILSDFNGIVMANYDSSMDNLQAALGPACDQIRNSVK